MARILEAQHGMHRRQEALNEALKAGLEAQHAFNRQQVAINQRLATLLERAWRRWMMTRRRKRREQADPCPWLDPIWQGDDARKTGLVRGVQRRRWPPARGLSAVWRRPACRRVGARRLRALPRGGVAEPHDGRGHDSHAAAGDPLHAIGCSEHALVLQRRGVRALSASVCSECVKSVQTTLAVLVFIYAFLII